MLLNNTDNSGDHWDHSFNINVKEIILFLYVCMSCESLSTFYFQITENIFL